MWQSLGFIPAPQNKTSWDCTYQASGIFSDLDGLSWPFLFSSLWSGCPLVAQMNSTSQYLLQIIIKCLPSKQQNRNRRDRERSSSIFLLSPFSLSLGDPHKKNYKQWRETSDVSRHSQALDSAAACMQENEALNVQYVRVSVGCGVAALVEPVHLRSRPASGAGWDRHRIKRERKLGVMTYSTWEVGGGARAQDH